MNIKRNRTKILATVGPAISDYDMMVSLIEAGVNVFRLNFSHGTVEEHLAIINQIEDINKKYDTNVGILADLQGPKIRIGEVKDGKREIVEGDILKFSTEENNPEDDILYMSYGNFAKDVSAGDRILIDDGKIDLEVIETDHKSKVSAKVVYGGVLSSRKGVNLPNTRISVPSLTEKDKGNLKFLMDCGSDVQWIALSFVRKPDDLTELRGILSYHNKNTKIIAKIERPEALDEIDEIIEAADGIMIARGDLGVEVPMEQIPMIQKRITRKCLLASKPVVIATQMMESMIEHSRPTRAEATDVANGVLDGADCLMLSGETSIGKYPLKVVESMQKIIREVEDEERIYYLDLKPDRNSPTYLSDAICYNAVFIAKHVDAKAIMGMTRSGYTAYQISARRPKAEIYIFTDSRQLIKQLSLIWGVRGFYYNKFSSTDDTFSDVADILRDNGLVEKGDLVLNTGSMPIDKRGRTNMLKISEMP